ncbi:MAG: InlB B-repeat-containing protein, partial [Erysipelotrichaceae bacterium]|nr:InlB B-repeat-containing protein [Erysipelotrichaceae bacterium]
KDWNENNVLCFEAGDLDRDDRWKDCCSSVSEICVIPNDKSDKLRLPADSSKLFYGLNSLTKIDTAWFDTSQVTDMSSMFAGCTSLKSLDLSRFETGKVHLMNSMFSGCTELETLDLSRFDTSKISSENCMDMFSGCSSLHTINLSKDFFKGTVTNSCPYTQQTKWTQLKNYHNVKSWPEMAQVWNGEDAGWWSLQGDVSYIAFNSNGGRDMAPLRDVTGSTIDLTQFIPSKTGYDFSGWFLDPECTEKADDLCVLNSDRILYAGWQLQNRTLTFDTGRGTKFNPLTVTYGSSVDLRYFFPVQSNFNFTGWFLDPECTTKADNRITLDSDTTVYAGWKPGAFFEPPDWIEYFKD